MINLPGFDPSMMSDEELMHKQSELMARIVYAARFSGTDMIARLNELLTAIEYERNERLFRQMWQDRQAMFPDVIESEPDLKENDEKVKQATEKKIVPQNKPRITVTRTSRPVDRSADDPES